MYFSGSALKPARKSPRQLCDSLIAFVPDGTLVMPAIPYYPEEPTGVDRLSDKVCDKVVTYDVKNSKAWTGVLPNTLLTYPDAIRSEHPLNSIVAIGKNSFRITKHHGSIVMI